MPDLRLAFAAAAAAQAGSSPAGSAPCTSRSCAAGVIMRGPPGTPNVPDSGSGLPTAGPAHANSICVFSGLNDMTVGEGPIDFIVQSYGQDVRTRSISPHVFHLGDACRGGSN